MTDTPVTDTPLADAPATDAPVAEEPATAGPVAEAAAADTPAAVHPDDADEETPEVGAATASDDGDDDDESDAEGDPLETEGEVAADYLEELLDIADLDGDIDTYVESGRAHVSIVTASDTLVGRDGAVLDALQELARLAVVTSTGRRSRLMLDVAGHREHRRQELTALATEAINEARETKQSVRLAPMNPYERKIVHDVVAGAGLTSESEGEEPRRRVVVIP